VHDTERTATAPLMLWPHGTIQVRLSLFSLLLLLLQCGLQPVSLIIKKSRLRWCGDVDLEDDNDWVKLLLYDVGSWRN